MALQFKTEAQFQAWLKQSKHIRLLEADDRQAEEALEPVSNPQPAKHDEYSNVELWVLLAVTIVVIYLIAGGYIP